MQGNLMIQKRKIKHGPYTSDENKLAQQHKFET